MKFRIGYLKVFLIVFVAGLAWEGPAQAGECPAQTEVSKLSGSSGFQKKGPYDLKSMSQASATETEKGLLVIISNGSVDAKAAAKKLPLPPLTGKGKVSLILSFENKGSLAAGNFQPINFTDPNYIRTSLAFGFEGGGMADSSTFNQGTAQITQLGPHQVCGKFSLSGDNGPIEGQFTATIQK